MMTKVEAKRNLFAAIFGILLSIKAFYGISFGEIVAVLVLPLYLVDKKVIAFKQSAMVVISTFVLYILSQVISDYMANEEFLIIIRDFGKLLSILALAISMNYFLRRNRNFIVIVLISYAFATVIQSFMEFASYESAYMFWRDGIGENLTIAVLVLAPYFTGPLNLIILITSIITNAVMDFRTMVGLSATVLILLVLNLLRDGSKILRISLVMAIILTITAFSIFSMVEDFRFGSSRRHYTSDLLRLAIAKTIADDLMRPTILGNGFSAFNKRFSVPDLGNRELQKRYSEKMDIHGYSFFASYNAGKLALIFYIAMFWYMAKLLYFISKNSPFLSSNIAVFVMGLYFIYGSFMLAFADFDRVVVAMAMTIVFHYSGKGRSALSKADNRIAN